MKVDFCIKEKMNSETIGYINIYVLSKVGKRIFKKKKES